MNSIVIYLGRHDFSDSTENGLVLTSDIYHNHPCRLIDDSRYDISLVKLSTKVNFNTSGPFIRPICLPDKCDRSVSKGATKIDDCDEIVEIAGWGKISNNGKSDKSFFLFILIFLIMFQRPYFTYFENSIGENS